MKGMIPVNTVKKNYFSIQGGFIVYKPKNGEPVNFEGIEGKLVEIRKRMIKKDGRELFYYDFDFKCDEVNNILSVPSDSNVSRSIVLTLANISNFDATICIKTWKSKNNPQYTNISISREGEKIKWLEMELPKGSAAITELDRLCKAINEAIHKSFVGGAEEEEDKEGNGAPEEFDGGPATL